MGESHHGAGKAPLGSILGPFTWEVVKVCSFLDGSAGSTWPHKDRVLDSLCKHSCDAHMKYSLNGQTHARFFFRFSLYLKLMLPASASCPNKQAVHDKAFWNWRVWLFLAGVWSRTTSRVPPPACQLSVKQRINLIKQPLTWTWGYSVSNNPLHDGCCEVEPTHSTTRYWDQVVSVDYWSLRKRFQNTRKQRHEAQQLDLLKISIGERRKQGTCVNQTQVRDISQVREEPGETRSNLN